MNILFKSLDAYRDTGLLILRTGIGILFIIGGYAKLSRGPESWEILGGALNAIGIYFAPKFMGFMAAISEFVGGILLILGLGTRIACFFLLCTMIVATVWHISKGDPRQVFFAPMTMAILFLSLIMIGPGKISLDEKMFK